MKVDKFTLKDLCDSCKNRPCCTSCDSPFLFSEDLVRLKKIKKSDDRYIDTIYVKEKSVKILKKKPNSSHCVMWDEKKNFCSIYENRPYDCRIFPFDIIKKNNQFFWIVFSCNDKSDWKWTEEHLQKLESDPQFAEIFANVEYYSSFFISKFDDDSIPPFTILRKIRPINDLITLPSGTGILKVDKMMISKASK